MTRSGQIAKEQAGFLTFLFRIGFQQSALDLQRFSLLVVNVAILTPELFFRRGTLEFAMRNVF
jgi:hypothetical protein